MAKKQRRKFETGFKKQLIAQIEVGQITASVPQSYLTGRSNFKQESCLKVQHAVKKL